MVCGCLNSRILWRKFVKQNVLKRLFASSAAPTIFTGIQPTGVLHFGNYFGAVLPWVKMQSSPEYKNSTMLFSVVDLHAITNGIHKDNDLRTQTLDMTASLLSCGVDLKRTILFQQSSLKQHLELAWILSSLATVPQLSRLPQYRDTQKSSTQATIARLSYPILQAADILLYRANLVPVGDDQIQHLEWCRHWAMKYNSRMGNEFFPQAQQVKSDFVRIKSLRSPEKKMSKSDAEHRNKICISDSPEVIKDRIKKAVTDFDSKITYNSEKRPGVSNLIDIYSAVTGLTPPEICAKHSDLNTGQFKLILVDILTEYFNPIRMEYLRLLDDRSHLENILNQGKERAYELAEVTMQIVRKDVGFR